MNDFDFDAEFLPTIKGQRIGNSKRIALLEYIAQFGSITQAAKAVPMSYKAAWDAIDALNNLSPQPLVVRQTGGKGGGSSSLTEYGQAFLHYYQQMHHRHQQLFKQLQQKDTDHYQLWQRMNLHLSADNQLLGRVSQIISGAVNNEVHLRLSTGQELIAVITKHSCEQMQLSTGVEAIALIQASAIMLARATDNFHLSARNQLPGQVRDLITGSVNDVVMVNIGDHLTLSAALTRGSTEHMQLQIGDDIVALIKASSIVLARLG